MTKPTSPIAISAGHAKHVRGASGYLDEVDEARRVCTQVAEKLRKRGVIVRGPFFDDLSETQDDNLEQIVAWHNNQERALDVSVHFNAYETTDQPMGTECWFLTQDALAWDVALAISSSGQLLNRGAKYSDDLYFLNNTHKPGVLIEVCFVDSSADAQLYEENFDAICAAIAQALSGVSTAARPPVTEPSAPPSGERPVIGVGDSGAWVVSVQQTLGLPNDGFFGEVTEAGVKGFQRACGIAADGVVGATTWVALDDLDRRMKAGDDGISDELAGKIEEIVSESPVTGYVWAGRGVAPFGYYAGMAKCYALALKLLAQRQPAAVLMAQANTYAPDTDALSWYADEFMKVGMDNSQDGVDTLRHLFVLMVGLGMCESSGNHWEGRDMSAENVEADTAEAGLFQASWNLATAAEEIVELAHVYYNDPNGFRPTFEEQAPTVEDLDNYGSGDGCVYQWLAKFCPAFAVLMTGVGLRRRRQHWGPLNRSEVVLVEMVDDLFIDVEGAVATAKSRR